MSHSDSPELLAGDVTTTLRSRGARRRAAVAAGDLVSGFGRWWLWTILAWYDIKQRYRGSMIGPFWYTLSTLVLVTALGVIYSGIFHVEIQTYLPYLAVGMITWSLISTCLLESCTIFVGLEQVIKQITCRLARTYIG